MAISEGILQEMALCRMPSQVCGKLQDAFGKSLNPLWDVDDQWNWNSGRADWGMPYGHGDGQTPGYPWEMEECQSFVLTSH